jgi:hypothetical protein
MYEVWKQQDCIEQLAAAHVCTASCRDARGGIWGVIGVKSGGLCCNSVKLHNNQALMQMLAQTPIPEGSLTGSVTW